jgi:ribosomal protein L7/L12
VEAPLSQRIVLKGRTAKFENKVGLTKLVRASTGFSLSEAKDCTDRLLEGAEVTIELPDCPAAEAFAAQAVELGLIIQRETAR